MQKYGTMGTEWKCQRLVYMQNTWASVFRICYISFDHESFFSFSVLLSGSGLCFEYQVAGFVRGGMSLLRCCSVNWLFLTIAFVHSSIRELTLCLSLELNVCLVEASSVSVCGMNEYFSYSMPYEIVNSLKRETALSSYVHSAPQAVKVCWVTDWRKLLDYTVLLIISNSQRFQNIFLL